LALFTQIRAVKVAWFQCFDDVSRTFD